MSAVAQVERLQEQMKQLKLPRTSEELPLLLQEAEKRELSCADFLEDLITREVDALLERRTAMKTTLARFPFHKTLETFDFSFQPSLKPKVIQELAKGRFIADADNVLLLGPPGVGKTHLAVALGLKACALGYRTLFLSAQTLLAQLVRFHSENRLEEKLKQLVQPKLLILDEIGYLPHRPAGGESLLSAGLAPLRARLDPDHLESEPGQLGQSLRRPGDRHGDPGSAAAPLDDHQREGRELSAEGETPGWTADPQRALHRGLGPLTGE